MADRVWQEFFCTKSGGGCGKYIQVKLNIAINQVVEIVCPNCGHKHQRTIQDGAIKEFGRYDNKPVEEVCPPLSACSDEPIAKDGQGSERDASIIQFFRNVGPSGRV